MFIGGCGAALCLITALLIAAKKSHNRKLGKVAGISVLFNISEIAIFGFPVIFNPVMFVPFILTPLVFVLTSTFAMTMGLVPYVTRSVEWTVPVIFSGCSRKCSADCESADRHIDLYSVYQIQ